MTLMTAHSQQPHHTTPARVAAPASASTTPTTSLSLDLRLDALLDRAGHANSGVSRSALAVLLYLVRRIRSAARETILRLDVKVLIAVTGYAAETIRRAKALLRDLGYIEVLEARGGGNDVRLLLGKGDDTRAEC